MRAHRTSIGLAVIALFVVALFIIPYCVLNADYLHFEYKNTKYHADFAEACDSVLIHHPLGTNKAMELSVTDPSLPRIISDWHPKKVGVAPNYVWIDVHDGHIGGLVIIWKPQWEEQNPTQTNTWNLCINSGEGPEQIVYVGSRK